MINDKQNEKLSKLNCHILWLPVVINNSYLIKVDIEEARQVVERRLSSCKAERLDSGFIFRGNVRVDHGDSRRQSWGSSWQLKSPKVFYCISRESSRTS